jgi:hypothetical protein
VEGAWTLAETVVDPAFAFQLISDGADWQFDRCGSNVVRPSDKDAVSWLSYAKQKCISEAERERLYRRGERTRRMPTVVMADRWTSGDGRNRIVFREDGPYPLAPGETEA